jgi:hypothetical protein
MIVWYLMREAAIWRHTVLHQTFENGDPHKWEPHARMIKAVYGY